jgi:hypothetical protein
VVDLDDYNLWRDHFGLSEALGAGALANSNVPEPAAATLALVAA